METARVTIVPKAVDDRGFTVERDRRNQERLHQCAASGPSGGSGRPTSATKRRGFLPTGSPLGVEEQLAKAGPRGHAVTIGAESPSNGCDPHGGTLTVEDPRSGGRGTDSR